MSARWRLRRRLWLLRRPRGQIAVAFVVFLALAVVLASATMNLGEVARLKTATANAADAGALAGASWVASGQNEMAKVAEFMWTNIMYARIFLFVPFCARVNLTDPNDPNSGQLGSVAGGTAIFLLASAISALNAWLLFVAENIMEQTWKIAKGDALFKTFDNLLIDDDGESPARGEMRRLREAFEASETVPLSPDRVRLEWDRPSDDSGAPSWVEIEVAFPTQRPRMRMRIGRLWGTVWSPPIWLLFFCCCWPAFGRKKFSNLQLLIPIILAARKTTKKTVTGRPGTFLGAGWYVVAYPLYKLLGEMAKPWWGVGFCGRPGSPQDSLTCFPIPIRGDIIEPNSIQFGGPGPQIHVSVWQHREELTSMPFWTMRYPDQIVSEARATYSEARLRPPKPDSLGQLVVVR